MVAVERKTEERFLTAWKAVLSEAIVTGDEVLGKKDANTAAWKAVPRYILRYSYLSQGTVFQTVVQSFETRDFVPGYDRFA